MKKKPIARSSGSASWSVDVRKLAVALFDALASPLSLSMKLLHENGGALEAVSKGIDASQYTDADKFRRDYLAVECFSKFPEWDLGIDREAVALAKFRESEEQCRQTNVRLRSFFELDLNNPASIPAVLFTARRKIEWLLGEFTWSEAERFFDLGPGASYSCPRRRRHAYYKFSGVPESTRQCAAAGDALVRSIPGWLFHLARLTGMQSWNDSLITVVPGNRVTTVPKNAKTDRVIAIEPLLNGVLQKGIGGVIRRRLRKVGIDLNDQRPNQVLAREGSKSNEFATIDLSSASDSVAIELVRQLLPSDWVTAIEICRSPDGVLPSGEIIHYQKVSSMGNGFTFELESLIFWALSDAVRCLTKAKERRFLVYGDDIIVPTCYSGRLIDVLSYCGFSCNMKKTFVNGPFRESCGKHYFRGVDVTPFYLRKEMNVSQLILLCNNLRRWSALGPHGLDGRFEAVYRKFVSFLPGKLQRPRIPDGYGDGALIGDFDECLPRRAKHGLEGFVANVRQESSTVLRVDGYPMLLSTLLVGERSRLRPLADNAPVYWWESLGSGAVVPSGCIPVDTTYENRKVLVPQWVSQGPWLHC